MSSLFSDLQESIAERLASQLADAGGPRGIEPLIEVKGDLVTQIRQRLDKIGLGIVVLTPSVRRVPEDGDNKIEARVTIGIAEKPIVNGSKIGSGVPAIDVVSAVLGSLHAWQPVNEKWSILQLEVIELGNVGEYVEYSVEYSTQTYLMFES